MSEVEYECSMCGREGGPASGCGTCNGNPRFLQVMTGYYLSDTKRAREDGHKRHGPDGQVGPKTHDPLWAGTSDPTKGF
jgi:hypothetical protein